MMEKGDIVIIGENRYICWGIHPHGDSMALIREDLVAVVEAAEPWDFAKADECEFAYDPHIKAWIY